MKRGEDEYAAWERVCRNKRYGLSRYRGAKRVPVNAVQRTLARFYLRMGAFETEFASAKVKRRAAEVAPRAFDAIVSIADGNFGMGKVLIRGDEEEVVIDAQAARTRLAASREILEMVGAVAQRGASQSAAAVQVNTQVNAQAQANGNVSLGAALRALKHVDVEAEAAKADAPPAE